MSRYIFSVDSDTAGLIKFTMNKLSMPEDRAIVFLTEIGLVNILSYPTGNPKIDDILKDKQEYVDAIKSTWNI